MKTLIIALFLLILAGTSCGTDRIGTKVIPQYDGVDHRAQKYLDEYLWLSKQHGIHFHNDVTIGFKEINKRDVIGLCTYGGYFREIDLDIKFWETHSDSQKLALMFHELSHCYCNRDHDYAKGKKYPETEAKRIEEAINWRLAGGDRPGRWEDGCPTSIMYPVLIGDDCFLTHYNDYVHEMFERCKPW